MWSSTSKRNYFWDALKGFTSWKFTRVWQIIWYLNTIRIVRPNSSINTWYSIILILNSIHYSVFGFFGTLNSIRQFKYQSEYLSKYLTTFLTNGLYETNIKILVAFFPKMCALLAILYLGVPIIRPNSTVRIWYSNFLSTK